MRYILIVLFSATLSHLAPAASDDVCLNTGQLAVDNPESELWVDITRNLAIKAADEDLKGFCEWNRMDRATGRLARSDDEIKRYRGTKFTGDREKAASQLAGNARGDNPWESSMLGHEKLKNLTISGFGGLCGNYTERAIDCAPKIAELLRRDDLNGDYQTPTYVSQGPLQVSNKELVGACGVINVLGTPGCVSASKELIRDLEIHKIEGYPNEVTTVPLLKETITDQRLTGALKRVASNLWTKIDAKSFSNSDNIFDELTGELKKDGFSSADAKKHALKILGSISTAGPNFATRIEFDEMRDFPDSCQAPKSCNLNSIYMSAIAEGMPIGDTIKMAAGHPGLYSLPATANYTCDIGKSYHFWMTAALTDRMVGKGHSTSAARSAVFVSHLGYHLRDAGSRDSSVLLRTPRYGAVENGLRMDINLAAAGSAFGAQIKEESPKNLDLKAGLITMMKEGNSSPASPDQQFSRSLPDVLEWFGRVTPKTAFDQYD